MSRQILGTARHLRVCADAGVFSRTWVDRPADNDWCVGLEDSSRNFDEILAALAREDDVLPAERWTQPWQELLKVDRHDPALRSIPWALTMPSWAVAERTQRLLRLVQEVFTSDDLVHYEATLEKTTDVIQSLQRIAVDEVAFDRCLSDVLPGKREVIAGFKPDRAGFAAKPVYTRATATGRMSVLSGPNPLLLPKDKRGILRSRFVGGEIVLLDYVSLEPRVVLADAGRPVVEDVYEHVSRDVLGGIVGRDPAKVVVMGILYGIGQARLSQVLGTKIAIEQIADTVKSHFGVRVLGERLAKQMKECGTIRNRYGRVLRPGRADQSYLVSHYVQSTGADVALQGFHSIVSHLRDEKLQTVPIMIIHDALGLDVHPSERHRLPEIAARGHKVSGYDVEFPIRVQPLCKELK